MKPIIWDGRNVPTLRDPRTAIFRDLMFDMMEIAPLLTVNNDLSTGRLQDDDLGTMSRFDEGFFE